MNPSKQLSVEIIILNFNGGDLFLDCLGSIVAASKESAHNVQVVVLDNLSSDNSEKTAKVRFPEIRVTRAAENKVLCSYNEYLAHSVCDVAILLNNDIRVDERFVDPLIEPFLNQPDTFMVTSRCMNYDGTEYEGGVTRFRMKYGVFWASSRYPEYEKDIQSLHFTMAAGYGAFDRKKFLELGGYDELYLPGRLEDSDICLRAWRKGWKLYCEPRSVVFHKGAVAFDKAFSKSGTLRIGHRNSFLFVWKNIHDRIYLAQHFIFLVPRLLYALLRGQKEFVQGFFLALPLFKRAWEKREKQPAGTPSDRELMRKV